MGYYKFVICNRLKPYVKRLYFISPFCTPTLSYQSIHICVKLMWLLGNHLITTMTMTMIMRVF